jgi:hypothetical protein
MTRRTMLERIKQKLGVKKLPKRNKIFTKVLLEVSIEKWEELDKYIEEDEHIIVNISKGHFPDDKNCALCYKYVHDLSLICPLSTSHKYCKGICSKYYSASLCSHTLEEFKISQQKLLKQLKKALQMYND